MPSTSSFDFSRIEAGARQNADRLNHELLRIRTELEFADGLCSLYPRRAAGWKRLIARAAARAETVASSGNLAEIRRRIPEIEKVLAPIVHEKDGNSFITC